MEDPEARALAWKPALDENEAIRKLEANLPGVLQRLRAALGRFEARHNRPIRMVAMDFGDQYWGDIGQHGQMARFFMALRDPGPAGDIARSLANLRVEPDDHGNRMTPDCRLGPGVEVRNSVLIDVHVDHGEIRDSVLVGTRCAKLEATGAFDVSSSETEMKLAFGGGSYKVVSHSRQCAFVPRGARFRWGRRPGSDRGEAQGAPARGGAAIPVGPVGRPNRTTGPGG